MSITPSIEQKIKLQAIFKVHLPFVFFYNSPSPGWWAWGVCVRLWSLTVKISKYIGKDSIEHTKVKRKKKKKVKENMKYERLHMSKKATKIQKLQCKKSKYHF